MKGSRRGKKAKSQKQEDGRDGFKKLKEEFRQVFFFFGTERNRGISPRILRRCGPLLQHLWCRSSRQLVHCMLHFISCIVFCIGTNSDRPNNKPPIDRRRTNVGINRCPHKQERGGIRIGSSNAGRGTTISDTLCRKC